MAQCFLSRRFPDMEPGTNGLSRLEVSGAVHVLDGTHLSLPNLGS